MTRINNIIKVGIIDTNTNMRNRLSSLIDATDYAEVSFAIADGMNAVEMIYESNPDVLIIDEALPFKAGIDVVSELSGMENKPYIIYTFVMCNEILLNRAIAAGIDEFVIKPYEPSSVVLRIKNVSHSLKKARHRVVLESVNGLREKVMEYESYSNIDRKRDEDRKITSIISEILFKDGFSSRHNGYGYILYAARLMYNLWPEPYSLSKDIYPAIQDEFEVNYDMTECAIRNAIRSAWRKHVASGTESTGVFAHFTKKPSNHEFLEMLTHMIYRRCTEI